jgi:hypothetical protein
LNHYKRGNRWADAQHGQYQASVKSVGEPTDRNLIREAPNTAANMMNPIVSLDPFALHPFRNERIEHAGDQSAECGANDCDRRCTREFAL